MSSTMVQWDPNSAQYKCCCQIFHITTGARVLAIVEVVCIGLVLLSDLVRLTAFDGSSISFTLNVIWVVFFGVVITLLFQAIKTGTAILALPHLIYQIISIIFNFLLLIFSIVALTTGSTWAMAAIGLSVDDSFYCPDNIDKAQCNSLNGYIDMDGRLAGCLVMIISFSLLISFQWWVFFVVRKLYRYLNDKAKFAPNMTSAAPYDDGSISRSQSFHIQRIYNIPTNQLVGPPPEYRVEMQTYHDENSHTTSQLPIVHLPPSPLSTSTVEQKRNLSHTEDEFCELQKEKKRDRNSSVLSVPSVSNQSGCNEE